MLQQPPAASATHNLTCICCMSMDILNIHTKNKLAYANKYFFSLPQRCFIPDDPDLEEFQLEIEESKLQTSVQCTPTPGKSVAWSSCYQLACWPFCQKSNEKYSVCSSTAEDLCFCRSFPSMRLSVGQLAGSFGPVVHLPGVFAGELHPAPVPLRLTWLHVATPLHCSLHGCV